MATKIEGDTSRLAGRDMVDALKSWTMTLLTVAFVLLYGAALIGWLRPPADERMVSRLEPIIFVIIGYYFGRLPGQQNEKTLKDEAARQTQRADAAQHAKEQAQQTREALEEKVKNARAILTPAGGGERLGSSAAGDKTVAPARDDARHHAVAAALNVLNS